MHMRIIFGSTDTEENELAVKPIGLPTVSVVVTMVTPVGKAPNACLNFLVSSLIISLAVFI